MTHRARSLPRWLALPVAVGALSCGPRGEMAILDGACHFGDERSIATLDGPEAHSLALAPRSDGAYAFWSEDSGLYAANLDGAGALVGDVRRIGPPCLGGTDAAPTPSGALLACGMPADDARGDLGRVVLYEVDPTHSRVREQFSPMGPDSRGVAVAANEERFLLAWHDARAGSAAVWSVSPTLEPAEPSLPEALRDMPVVALTGREPRRVSREGVRAGAPSALWVGGTRLLAWTETALDPSGDPLGDLFVQTDDGAPRSIATVQHESVSPMLAAAGTEVLLTFRDRRARGRPRTYAMWVPRGGETGRVASGAPANLPSPALGVPCMGEVLLVAPRTHSRHERLVSVRQHDHATLEGRGPELQIYSHGEAYEDADALCLTGAGSSRLLVLFAARENDEHEPGHVRTTSVVCE